MVYEKIQQGQVTDPRFNNDNYECFLDTEIEVKKECLKPYYNPLEKSNHSKQISFGGGHLANLSNDLDQSFGFDAPLDTVKPENEHLMTMGEEDLMKFDPAAEIEKQAKNEPEGLLSPKEVRFQIPHPRSNNTSMLNETQTVIGNNAKKVY